MLTISNGEKTISLDDAIANAAEDFCFMKKREEGEYYDQSRVEHQIGEFLIDLLDSFNNGELSDLVNRSNSGRLDVSSYLRKLSSSLQPIHLTLVEKYQDQIAA